MSIEKTLDLVEDARRRGFAVPAVNVVDELSIRATVEAAESLRSPIILQTSVKTVRTVGAEALFSAYRATARRSSVPVSLHLDHCPDPVVIQRVIDAGWSSVLYDASHLDLDEAVATTDRVVTVAHQAGVAVESEIENIVGVEDGVGSDEATHSYSDEELVDVAVRTRIDLLAPALGTAHGLYTSAPELLIDRARRLSIMLDRPIVLHGGTGLSDAEFREFVQAGVSKINISTALKRAYMESALAHLEDSRKSNQWEPTRLFDQIASGVRDVIARHIVSFGAAETVSSSVPVVAS
jgi:ketose-bisphosphate aldolase